MTTVSLIITTYNWPTALKLSLESIINQTHTPNEIIIADDGSTSETKEVIQHFVQTNPQLNVIHSWQEDKGFRLSRSRNLAIKKSKGDYLIIIDGDMILERHFVEDHLHVAKEKRFVSGRRVLLKEAYSKDIVQHRHLPSLFSAGIKKHRFLSIRNITLSTLRSSINTKTCGILGCNMAFFRRDAIAINGFNEAFVGWGAEDTEFVARMLNNGCEKMKLKHLAIGYHLYHPEACRSMKESNCDILQETLVQNLTYCTDGLNNQS